MSDRSDRTKRVLRQLDRITVIGALLAIALCVTAYFSVPVFLPRHPDLQDFVKGLSTDLTVAFILFAGAYFAFKQIESIKFEERADDLADRIVSRSLDDGAMLADTLEEAPWKEYLAGSKRIQIYAQHCDTWVATHGSHLRRFFEAGGHAELVLPAHYLPGVIASIQWRRSKQGDEEIQRKIVDTYERLFDVCEDAAHPDARVTVHFVKHPILHHGMCFDARHLVLLWYEHIRGPSGTCPAVCIDLKKKPGAWKWWDKEFRGLKSSADRQIEMVRGQRREKGRIESGAVGSARDAPA